MLAAPTISVFMQLLTSLICFPINSNFNSKIGKESIYRVIILGCTHSLHSKSSRVRQCCRKLVVSSIYLSHGITLSPARNVRQHIERGFNIEAFNRKAMRLLQKGRGIGGQSYRTKLRGRKIQPQPKPPNE